MEDAYLQAIWGKQISPDIFKRWNQGFVFSQNEPLALVQNSGGPCAVLAPVQAFIFQRCLYGEDKESDLSKEEWRTCTDTVACDLLISALSHILHQTSSYTTPRCSCKIATLATPTQSVAMDTCLTTPTSKEEGASSSGLKRKHPSPLSEDRGDYKREPLLQGEERGEEANLLINIEQLIKQTEREEGVKGSGLTLEALSSALSSVKANISLEAPPINDTPTSLENPPTSDTPTSLNTSEAPPTNDMPLPTTTLKGSETYGSVQTPDKGSGQVHISELLHQSPPSTATVLTDSEIFHNQIRIITCNDVSETMSCLRDHLADLRGHFGVLLFLYSLVLTKGIEQLTEESEENEQPLIDPLHGHGSQNLINMLLVGRCVTNVFDLDKDLGGIKLRGIPCQSTVGFLTILESLRYCEVGDYLKSPRYPVWVIGSETHLTVLFSIEIGLTLDEDSQTVARRQFEQFNYNGETGLMATSMLGDLMKRLDLETDHDYVEFMKSKLDPESTGVILLDDFLSEFYPYPMEFEKPKAFTVYHYNGLLHNKGEKIQLVRGQAAVLGEEGSTNTEISLINCLHTKWPALIIHWDQTCEPKII